MSSKRNVAIGIVAGFVALCGCGGACAGPVEYYTSMQRLRDTPSYSPLTPDRGGKMTIRLPQKNKPSSSPPIQTSTQEQELTR